MKKLKNTVALLLVFSICLALLFSSFYIASGSHHNCIGEDCPICYKISICEDTLKILSTALTVFFILFAVYLFAVRILSIKTKTFVFLSPISLKVKLLN